MLVNGVGGKAGFQGFLHGTVTGLRITGLQWTMANFMTGPTNDFLFGQAKEAEHGFIGVENAEILLQEE